MKVFANKFLIIGTLVLLLVSVPLTLFLIKRQQDVRSQAAPTSRLYFAPPNTTTSTQCQSFTMDVMIDPGSNLVSIVDFYITYDATKLDVLSVQENSVAFPNVVRQLSIANGEANMSVSVGTDVTKTVQEIAKVATITFKSKVEGQTQTSFDSAKSRVFSLNTAQDLPTENVLFTTTAGNITTNSAACNVTTTPGITITPNPTLAAGVTPTTAPGTGGNPTSTPRPPTGTPAAGAATPTLGANQLPTCLALRITPSNTGAAPFATTLTADGTDPNTGGLVTKATFNFGDGTAQQEVTQGLNLKTVTAQIPHTYTTGGTFTATVSFTDNQSGVSTTCNQTVTVTGGSATATPSATLAPTSAPIATTVPTTPPAKPTAVAAPTIPPTGGITTTLGIVGAVSLTVIVGFILLAL